MNDKSTLFQLNQTRDELGKLLDKLFAANQLVHAAVLMLGDLRDSPLVNADNLSQAMELFNQGTSKVSTDITATYDAWKLNCEQIHALETVKVPSGLEDAPAFNSL